MNNTEMKQARQDQLAAEERMDRKEEQHYRDLKEAYADESKKQAEIDKIMERVQKTLETLAVKERDGDVTYTIRVQPTGKVDYDVAFGSTISQSEHNHDSPHELTVWAALGRNINWDIDSEGLLRGMTDDQVKEYCGLTQDDTGSWEYTPEQYREIVSESDDFTDWVHGELHSVFDVACGEASIQQRIEEWYDDNYCGYLLSNAEKAEYLGE